MIIILILTYIVIAVCVHAYGLAVLKHHRYIDVWYSIGYDEEDIFIVSMLWLPCLIADIVMLPFKGLHLLISILCDAIFNKKVK